MKDKTQPPEGRKDIEFKLESVSHGLYGDGALFSVLKFTASDGGTVYMQNTRCYDDAAAKRAFGLRLSGPVKVVERGVKVNKNRQVVGERALLNYTDGRPRKGLLVWTDGPLLHEVNSDSVQDVLAFEKHETEDLPPVSAAPQDRAEKPRRL